MSLLYTMQGMRECGHKCEVALVRPSNELAKLYGDAGFRTHCEPGISLWDHSTVAPQRACDVRTWHMFAKLCVGWHRTLRLTRKIVQRISPDITHLNSMPFVPSARALTDADIPYVWHVREPPFDQGPRTRIIRSFMRRAPQLIFISNYDRQQWVGGSIGEVVSNFVDFVTFDRQCCGDNARIRCGIGKETCVLLYLGGLSEIKGIFPLLDALAKVKAQRTDWVCVMPGSQYRPSSRLSSRIARKLLPVFGGGTIAQRFQQNVAKLRIGDRLVILPFTKDIVPYYAACEMLLFPSISPHYARPVVEAASMGKPSIGSNLGGVNELIINDQTGLLVEPGSARALADSIMLLLENRDKARKLGENAYEIARERFDAKKNVRRIEQIYDTILTK